MNTTITNIIIESGISLSILTVVYLLFLRKETYFRLNRIYLLVSLLFSFLLPFLHIPVVSRIGSVVLGEVTVTAAGYQNLLEAVTIYGSRLSGTFEDTVSAFGIVRYLYLGVASLLAFLFIYRLLQVFLLVHRNEIEWKNGIRIVKIDFDITPFSFFNTIFVNRNYQQKPGMTEMLAHEMEHVKQLHSLDVIVLEIAAIFQWFNPFVWLMKRSLRENHEFLADHGVLKPGTSPAAYQLLLLSSSMGEQPLIANNFNYSLIKNRIKMIAKLKSSKTATLKLTLGILATMALILFFACETKQPNSKPVDQPTAKEVVGQPLTAQPEEKVFNLVEQMPQYPGGEQGLREFIGKSVTYPEDARKAGIQGKVFISFVINKEGKVVDAKVVRSANPSLDQEALRVIGLMPEWIPGKEKGENVAVQYTLPINFALK